MATADGVVNSYSQQSQEPSDHGNYIFALLDAAIADLNPKRRPTSPNLMPKNRGVTATFVPSTATGRALTATTATGESLDNLGNGRSGRRGREKTEPPIELLKVSADSSVIKSYSQNTAASRAESITIMGSTASTATIENFRCASSGRGCGRRGRETAISQVNLDRRRPVGDVPPARWSQFVADAEALIAGGWATQARALGWAVFDLFGCDPDRPFARIDQQGLCWLLNGRKVIALTATAATIETSSGARLTYRRGPGRKGQMLPWHGRRGRPRQCR
jgi:hypothetical protein